MTPDPPTNTQHPTSLHWFTSLGRVVGYTLIVLVLQLVAGMVVIILTDTSDLRDIRFLTPSMVAAAIVTLVVTSAYGRTIDGRTLKSYGLAFSPRWLKEFAFGTAAAIATISLIFAVAYLAGWVKVTGSILYKPLHDAALTGFGSIIAITAVALSEETAFRGYILQTLERGFGTVGSVIISSAVFGIAHLANSGAGPAGLVGTTAAGFLLAYAYLTTRRLWLAIGIHLGWDYAMAAIYGFPTSGIIIPSWLKVSEHGPNWWLGGRFGPEAAVSGWIGVLILMVAVRLYSMRVQDTRTAHNNRSARLPRPEPPS